jgi:hypothetical protein
VRRAREREREKERERERERSRDLNWVPPFLSYCITVFTIFQVGEKERKREGERWKIDKYKSKYFWSMLQVSRFNEGFDREAKEWLSVCLFVKSSNMDECIGLIRHSKVITFIKPDVFVFCHTDRSCKQISVKNPTFKAQYHLLVEIFSKAGTLTP